MNHSAVTASAIRAKLGNYLDPYLDQTWSQAKAIVDVSADAKQVTVELKFGFPVADYADELLPVLQSYLKAELGAARLNLVLRSETHLFGMRMSDRQLDHEAGARVQRRQVPGQHQADLVREDFLAFIIDHAATVAVAVEAER